MATTKSLIGDSANISEEADGFVTKTGSVFGVMTEGISLSNANQRHYVTVFGDQ